MRVTITFSESVSMPESGINLKRDVKIQSPVTLTDLRTGANEICASPAE